MNLGETIRNARLNAGLSARELARAVGLSHSYISQVEMGGIATPSPGVLKKIAGELKTLDYRHLLVVSGYIARADELGDLIEPPVNERKGKANGKNTGFDDEVTISDRGDLVLPADKETAQRVVRALCGNRSAYVKAVERKKSMAVPIVGSIPAGSAPVNAVNDKEPLDSMNLPDNIHGTGPFSALKVVGDSMKDDGILDGDVVVIDEGCELKNGDIYAVQIEGEYPTIKRILMSRDFFVLAPSNSSYTPTVVKVDEIGRTIALIGKVVYSSRIY